MVAFPSAVNSAAKAASHFGADYGRSATRAERSCSARRATTFREAAKGRDAPPPAWGIRR
jgi:hypothetical protein